MRSFLVRSAKKFDENLALKGLRESTMPFENASEFPSGTSWVVTNKNGRESANNFRITVLKQGWLRLLKKEFNTTRLINKWANPLPSYLPVRKCLFLLTHSRIDLKTSLPKTLWCLLCIHELSIWTFHNSPTPKMLHIWLRKKLELSWSIHSDIQCDLIPQ